MIHPRSRGVLLILPRPTNTSWALHSEPSQNRKTLALAGGHNTQLRETPKRRRKLRQASAKLKDTMTAGIATPPLCPVVPWRRFLRVSPLAFPVHRRWAERLVLLALLPSPGVRVERERRDDHASERGRLEGLPHHQPSQISHQLVIDKHADFTRQPALAIRRQQLLQQKRSGTTYTRLHNKTKQTTRFFFHRGTSHTGTSYLWPRALSKHQRPNCTQAWYHTMHTDACVAFQNPPPPKKHLGSPPPPLLQPSPAAQL